MILGDMNEIANTPDEQPQPTHHPKSASKRRALRWLVPAAAAGVVALVASGVLSADANPNLPPQTAAQLLAAIDNTNPSGFSGTIVEKASLGLPELPKGAGNNAGVLDLLTGSHTSRVWYGSETKQRFALLDSLGEQDVFRNGREFWHWDSNTHTATHTVLPADAGKAPTPSETATVTPEQAAQQALALIDPTTNVTTDRAAVVAGRSAYTLVLTPKDSRSRVASVRISIDGQHKLPLGVQVYARGSNKAALDVSFTRIDFSVPSDENFTFVPPSGAKVKQSTDPASTPNRAPGTEKSPTTGPTGMKTIGKGWTTVVAVSGVGSVDTLASQNKELSQLFKALPAVSGAWGHGHLFESALATALITDDGRAFIGAVDPAVLYEAVGAK
jgi:outer membrane lipoprotein-sorting protein